MKRLAIACLLLGGCAEPEVVELAHGICVQRCVDSMLDEMAASDHNRFTADVLAESQRICTENLKDARCLRSQGCTYTR